MAVWNVCWGMVVKSELLLFRFLNLNGPLQLGGVSTTNLLYPKLTVANYEGCIRNVINQGRYYDLKTPIHRNGTKEGCPMVDQHCRNHQCDARSKCVPSWTGYSCHCHFGFTGSTCGRSKFRIGSFVHATLTVNSCERECLIRVSEFSLRPDRSSFPFPFPKVFFLWAIFNRMSKVRWFYLT